ncbi:serine protease [Clostridium botulinum]|uniref:S8 family serine peptidase n=1 Tax=Clostridium botulinum TaxID=1491 RepID=UPI0007E074E8|nr:S8 family serine peptidase [Clostridium botulinum]KEI79959.1 serine protease [Clostridium botulinum B2 331]NEZ76853.1 serine protease [Clostridium botulinum]NFA00515.1 serine protease [Clostridium botulinum]NFA31147.1 serine protease [Clostridium botulinum]NFA86800.1 serine protease [Clostridium botulinum]
MKPIIVIIDSGINRRILGNNSFNKNSLNRKDKALKDEFGHGTACAMVIKSICPDVEFISIPILDKEGFSNSDNLEKALTYCLDIHCHIINLSLAILDNEDNKIEELCTKLSKQNKVIISSVRNNFIDSKPAKYSSVIGVRGGGFSSIDKYWFNSNYEIQLITDMTPVFTDPQLNRHFIFSGNSKATAVATGLIAKIINEKKQVNIEDILLTLSKNTIKKTWTEKDLDISLEKFTNCSKYNIGEISKTYYGKIMSALQIVCRDYGIEIPNNLDNEDNLFKMGVMCPEIIRPFFKQLEKEFKIPINESNMKPYLLLSLKSIYYAIRGVQIETY